MQMSKFIIQIMYHLKAYNYQNNVTIFHFDLFNLDLIR